MKSKTTKPKSVKPPFEITHYGKLTGKLVKTIVTDGGSEGQECFGLKFTDGTIAWIMCDPEGNGPGFLDIQPLERT